MPILSLSNNRVTLELRKVGTGIALQANFRIAEVDLQLRRRTGREVFMSR